MVRYANHDIVFREFPDEVALAINLSGCPNACPGCHSAYLQTDAGDELTSARLDALLDGLDGLITCVGFMGGDADPSGVRSLAVHVRRRWPKLRTGWYSGRDVVPAEMSTACSTTSSSVPMSPPSVRSTVRRPTNAFTVSVATAR